MTLRKRPATKASEWNTREKRDAIAMRLLAAARAGHPEVYAVWYGGGMSIGIKRAAIADIESIPWSEAHKLAYPGKYVEPEAPRKPVARYEPSQNNRKLERWRRGT